MSYMINIKSKLYPQDYNKETGTLAIKLPTNNTLNKSSNNLFNMSYTTEEQAVSNYINLLLTKKGERYMQPEFGVGLPWFLFENNTGLTTEQIETEIEIQSSIWLPYIIINNLIIKEEYSQTTDINGLMIQISFSVTEQGANREITIFKSNDLVMDIEVN